MYDGGQTGGGFSALLRSRPSGGELDEVVRAALQRLVAQAEALPDSFEVALANDGGWEKLDALRSETQQLLELLGAPLSEVLGLPVGFNSYDGD